MRRDTVKGVLENFHASTPRFSAAFPRGVKTYRGGEKKEGKKRGRKRGARGCDVTLQIRRGAIKVWIQDLLSPTLGKTILEHPQTSLTYFVVVPASHVKTS